MGLRIPTGTRARDLDAPLPGQEQLLQATTGAEEQLSQLEPARAPASEAAPSGETAGLLQEFAEFSPETQALLSEFGQGGEQQGPPEALPGPATALAGGGLQSGQLVRRADGKLGVLEPDGKGRDLTDAEKKSLEYISLAVRTGGPLIGGLVGGLAGGAAGFAAGGPAGSAIGAELGGGIGGASGSRIASAVASPLTEAASGQPLPQPTTASSLTEAALGAASGAGFSAAGRAMAPAPFNVQAAEETLAGARSQAETAAARGTLTQEVGGSAAPEQVNVGLRKTEQIAKDIQAGRYGPALQAQQDLVQAGREAKYKGHLDEVRRQFPQVGDEALSPRQVVTDLIEGNQREIAQYKGQVYKVAGETPFDVSQVDAGFKRILDERSITKPGGGIRDPKELSSGDRKILAEYQRFISEANPDVVAVAGVAGPQGSKGLPVKAFDAMLDRVRKDANFDGGNARTPEQRAMGELYHEVRIARDTAAARAMDSVDPQVATSLRSSRDRYSAGIKNLRQWERTLQSDPENFTRALIKKDSPQNVRDLKATLSPETFSLMKRQFLDNVIGDLDPLARDFNSSTASKAFDAYGDKVLSELYEPGELKQLRTLFNYGKVIERRNYKSLAEANKDSVLKEFTEKANKGVWGSIVNATDYMYKVTQRKKVHRDYFGGKLGIPATAEEFAAQVESTSMKAPKEPTLQDLISSGAFTGATGAVAGALQEKVISELLPGIMRYAPTPPAAAPPPSEAR